MAPKKRTRSVTIPTMRLISLSNCITQDASLGLNALETSIAMATPLSHADYELVELAPPTLRDVKGMPWEQDDESFRKFRAALPANVTGADLYEKVALPILQQTADAPQRSDAWHVARSFAVTASQFASASDENPNMSRNKLLAAKTYPKRDGFSGNAFTEWGSVHEKHAEEAFVQFLESKLGTATKDASGDVKFADGSKLTHPSHKRDATTPYLGFSPDALLWGPEERTVSLVEYKCPAYNRSGPGHPYAAKNELCVPRQYMPQIQGSLHILRACYPAVECVRAWFVVWQAHQFFVTHIPFVPKYATRIVEASSTFFKDQFLPACADAVRARDSVLTPQQ